MSTVATYRARKALTASTASPTAQLVRVLSPLLLARAHIRPRRHARSGRTGSPSAWQTVAAHIVACCSLQVDTGRGKLKEQIPTACPQL
jgi:hypothetical protein